MIERPDTQYRIYRSQTVGDNQGGGIGAMTLPGTRIRGVIVDNPSGSWVKLDGTGLGFEPYVQPYTLAWGVSLLPSVDELSAAYVPGPLGQPSSTVGSPMVVYVFEAQVPNSGGSQFVPQTNETTLFNQEFVAFVGGASLGNLIVPSASQRIRLFNADASKSSEWSGSTLVADSGAILTLVSSVPGAIRVGRLELTPEVPRDAIDFAGLTLLPGAVLSADLRAMWGRTFVTLGLRYALV